MKNMKYASILLAASLLLSLASCRETITGEGDPIRQDRALAGFTEVNLEISGDVEISQGSTFAVVVEAQNNLQAAITTEVKGDELIIGSDKNIHSSRPIRIHVTMPSLEAVDVSGSGSVVVKDMFEPEHLEVEMSGSGSLKGQFAAGEIESEINGSGDVELSGKAGRHEGNINGSGNIRAGNLETKESKLTINGSGDADIAVLERLDVTINGSGDVTYRGAPEHQSTSINGSGRVTRR